jgi:hypothetical protein
LKKDLGFRSVSVLVGQRVKFFSISNVSSAVGLSMMQAQAVRELVRSYIGDRVDDVGLGNHTCSG